MKGRMYRQTLSGQFSTRQKPELLKCFCSERSQLSEDPENPTQCHREDCLPPFRGSFKIWDVCETPKEWTQGLRTSLPAHGRVRHTFPLMPSDDDLLPLIPPSGLISGHHCLNSAMEECVSFLCSNSNTGQPLHLSEIGKSWFRFREKLRASSF